MAVGRPQLPGHWLVRGDPETGLLDWKEGKMAPADAIFTDFMIELRTGRSSEEERVGNF